MSSALIFAALSLNPGPLHKIHSINSNCLKSSLDIEGKDIYSNSLGTEGDLFKISKFNKSNQNNISVINKNNISKFIADDNLNNISVLFENPNLLNLLEEELIEGVQKNQNSTDQRASLAD